MEVGRHSMEQEEKKTELGLHTITHGFEKEINETVTKVVDESLRSGRKIEFDGSIVVLGDVNSGAEIIAKEHIIVLGTLRGLAHAGAGGNRSAMIVANEIDAAQVRIADIVKEIERPVYDEMEEEEPKKKGKNKEEPETIEFGYDDIKTRAYVKENEIILE